MIIPRHAAASVSERKSNLASNIDQSGNSDVDVKINMQVDTMPIAFAVLGLALANNQLTEPQYQTAINQLVEATNTYQNTQKHVK